MNRVSATAASDTKRKNDADGARRDILAVAMQEFAAHGLSGARVDAIAEKTRTSKRMIYYYFGSKEGLYLAALEKAYVGIRTLDSGMHLDTLPPLEAMQRLVEITFDYHEANPAFVRMVSIENIHGAEHLKGSPTIRGINDRAIEGVSAILKRGQASGEFRADYTPLDLHLLISGLCFYRVSNRATFGTIFGLAFDDPEVRERQRRMTVETVLRLVRKT